jgi:stearoyl-CoA desaturase (delta-9 desaturase)
MPNRNPRGDEPRRMWLRAIPFLIVHLMPLGAFFTGVRASDLMVCVALYAVRMFFITAGFHRYFAHRAFRTHRLVQFVLAFGAQTSAQRGTLWWAAHHRQHHKESDTPEDPHSPLDGFWWSHVAWIFHRENRRTRTELIPDLMRYPELRFLDRFHHLPAVLLALAVFLWGGASALFIGFFLSTVLVYHGTFVINSLAHVFGSRRFVTRDTSRNNLVLALVTGGEGWHNNHHHYPASARQGFAWWEIDASFYVLWVASKLGVVRDLLLPTTEALGRNLVVDGFSDIGLFRAHWRKAQAALASRRVRTSEFYDARRRALVELMTSTRTAAEEIARGSRPGLEAGGLPRRSTAGEIS